VKSVSIDNAVVYGFDSPQRRMWFRLPSRPMDEFIQLNITEADRVAEFTALMQNSVHNS
jgi:hypothetical protein